MATAAGRNRSRAPREYAAATSRPAPAHRTSSRALLNSTARRGGGGGPPARNPCSRSPAAKAPVTGRVPSWSQISASASESSIACPVRWLTSTR